MAALLGVDVDRTISLTFVMGAALAAVAGLMVTLYYGVDRFLHRLPRRRQGVHRRRARRHRLVAGRDARRAADRPDRGVLVRLFLGRVQGRVGLRDPGAGAGFPARPACSAGPKSRRSDGGIASQRQPATSRHGRVALISVGPDFAGRPPQGSARRASRRFVAVPSACSGFIGRSSICRENLRSSGGGALGVRIAISTGSRSSALAVVASPAAWSSRSSRFRAQRPLPVHRQERTGRWPAGARVRAAAAVPITPVGIAVRGRPAVSAASSPLPGRSRHDCPDLRDARLGAEHRRRSRRAARSRLCRVLCGRGLYLRAAGARFRLRLLGLPAARAA